MKKSTKTVLEEGEGKRVGKNKVNLHFSYQSVNRLKSRAVRF